jgi:hypothetical protein
MKRIAHIDGTTIVNVSLADDDEPLAPNRMLESDALAAGYTYRTVTITPEPITRRQLKRWLLAQGLLAQVPALIAAITDDNARAEAQIDWEDASVFEVTNPLVVNFATALGLDNDQLHAAWREAALIE